jgi:predicted nucleotidyltransferase
LGPNFVGAYLHGSFALGDWDSHSDVDFLVVIEHPLSDAELAALQEMHGRIHDRPSPWAQHLEGSYFPRDLLKHGDHTETPLYYLDNGSRELVLSNHDNELVVLWVTRECGLARQDRAPAGPDADSLVAPVLAKDLRQEVFTTMQTWGREILEGEYPIDNRWAQPFAVLSTCRMLHTLHTATITSKPAAARWAQATLDSRWVDLIQRAWDDRPNPSVKVRQPADPDDVERTRAFIKYALVVGREYRDT